MSSTGVLVQNNVALNPKIIKLPKNSGLYAIFRIFGLIDTGTTNNYARGDMRLYDGASDLVGSLFTGNLTHDAVNGQSIASTEWNNPAWWTGTANWSAADWDFQNGQLPMLKTTGGTLIGGQTAIILP